MNLRATPILILITVFCATFIPRMLLIGGPPATDEGIYAYNALLIHLNPAPGWLLPDSGTLNLYPAMISWVFGTDLNPFLLLRFADAIIAALAGVMLYRVLAHESGSAIAGACIAIAFLLTLNDPVFVQYGFKNSIAAASLPMLFAIAIGQQADHHRRSPWFWCGVLMAVAVMLREPFVILAVAGTFAAWARGGLRNAIAYAVGGILTSALILLLVIGLRGGVEALVQSYFHAGQIVGGIEYQQGVLLQTTPVTFAKNAAGALLVSGSMLIVLAVQIMRSRAQGLPWRTAFWLALALLPLVEPLLKNGYPYHFATSLIGLSGLTALGWRTLRENPRQKTGILAMVLLLVFTVLLLPKLGKLAEVYGRYTRTLVAQSPLSQWPLSTIRQSNYLLIAETIRQQAGPGATLAINGSMLGVIPLSGLRPSRPDLAHLSYRYLETGNDPRRLQASLYECPPDFVMLTNSSPFRDTRALLAVVRSMPEYAPAGHVPLSDARSYGSFDGAIFKWMPADNPCRRPVAGE